MPRLRFRTFAKGLVLMPAADETPLDALRRARNVSPLLDGRITSAPPFVLVEDPGVASTLQSMTRYDGKLFAVFASGVLRRNAPPWATVALPGAYTTHPAIALSSSFATFVKGSPTDEVFEHLFIVDQGGAGDNLFKVNAAGVATRWGIHPLTEANVTSPNLLLEPQSEKFIHSAASDPLELAGDWTLASADEDALSGPTTLATEATIAIEGNSLKLTVARDDSAQITRAYGANIDLTTFGGGIDSTDEDFIQFWVRVRRSSRIENFEVAFDTTAAGDFADTYFSREITFKQVNRRKKAELIALGDLVKVGEEQTFLQERQGRPDDLTYDAELGNQQISVAKNTWTRVTLPKSSFEKVGTPDWATVRAIRFTCAANKEGRTSVFIDRLTLNGGVGMLGRYKYTFTLRNSLTGTRSNPFITEDGEIVNETPLMSGGGPAFSERQGVSLLFPFALTFDPQADEFEVWRTLGNGEVYFKAGYIELDAPGTLDAGTEIIDRTADYVGLRTSMDAYDDILASGAGTYHGNAYLDPTEELPLDNDTPNASDFLFRDAFGPHVGRMWWLNNQVAAGGSGNLYYSPSGRLEAVSAFIQVTSGESDALVKGVVWNERAFVFSAEGLFEISGTDEPFIARRIEGAPGTFFPNTVIAANIGIFYLAYDGIYYFDGISATNITDATLFPIFHAREAIEDFAAVSIPGFAAAGRNAAWFGGGLSGSLFTYVFDFDTRAWRYREPVSALYYDHTTGGVFGGFGIAGTNDDIYSLEPSPFNTAGVAYTLSLKTSEVRAGPGVKGVLRKFYVDIDSVSEPSITVDLIIDDATVALGTLSVVTGRRLVEFNVNRAGERFAALITGTSINEKVVLYGLEMDLYVPQSAAPDIA